MAIQVRRGLYADFDPTKMLPGEWAISIDEDTSKQVVWMCFAPGVVKQIGTGGEHLDEAAIERAVSDYLKENPVQSGATPEQAEQIEKNTEDISNLSKEIEDIKENGGGTGTGSDGEDGFSPIATVTETEDGAEISITDVNGTTKVTVLHGKDGKDGADGKDGVDGKDGHTPVKGVDYFDGEKGEQGVQGKQGIQGEKGDKGDTGEKGADGADYVLTNADKEEIAGIVETDCLLKNQGSANVGKILVVGADGNLALTDMPSGNDNAIGYVDENNNIILSGLNDGTYVIRYENTDGTYADIATYVVGGVVQYSITPTLANCTGASSNATVIDENGTVTLTFTANNGYELPETVAVSGATYTWNATTGKLVLSNPTADITISITAIVYVAYTNVLPLAQEYASTSPYVGSDGSVGYGNNMRISTSSASATYMKALAGVDATALIPVKRGDVLRFKNCNLKVSPANTSYGTQIIGFGSSKEVVQGFNLTSSNLTNRVPNVIEDGEYVEITLEPKEAWTTSDIDNLAFIMIATDGLDETSIITINEEIVD